MSAATLGCEGGKRVLVGVEVRLTRKGYTLTLHRREGAFPVLGLDGREPKRWRRLEQALAFLTEQCGAMSSIRLSLDDEQAGAAPEKIACLPVDSE